MLISQVRNSDGTTTVAVRERDGFARAVRGVVSLHELALKAANTGAAITSLVKDIGLGEELDLAEAYSSGRLLCPITHPDPAHLYLTGTGLTHLGSAATRDAMHKEAMDPSGEALTDSMKMFRMGLKGGKPQAGETGVQPEWFYKGNGKSAVSPGMEIASPSFALDGGEEPEIAGIYVIADSGQPFRIGFALANEFSDHVTERVNYLYLAHSKLRECSFGPEILVGSLPEDIQGISRIIRSGDVFWEKPFSSGEANMSHTIANLEHHHFKYDLFREPGDIHVHMFGTATLSFADGVRAEEGDVFEIEAPNFGLPLRNRLAHGEEQQTVVGQL